MSRTRLQFFLIFFPIIAFGQQNAEEILKARGEVYFYFLKSDQVSVSDLSRIISIDIIKSDTIWAYANSKEYSALKLAGIVPQILTAPSLQYKSGMGTAEKSIGNWDSYPSYEGYVSMMQNWAASYPAICRLDTIGSSIQGRYILALKITDSADSRAGKPQVLYSSSMHGDETTGYALMLHLIDTLLSSCNSSPQIKRLIDSLEIWINPLSNPDGTYFGGNSTISGATRYNANGVDLNRNYPDPQDGDHPDGNDWQPENIAMMNFLKQHHFILSANFHGGSEVMNYPWDRWFTRHPDDAWFQQISHQFADSAQKYGPPGYFTDVTSSGITDGYDWYTISGGRQDYVTYYLGGREITIEISSIKTMPGNFLSTYWNATYRSLLDYLEQALYGIQGSVKDTFTGFPVRAKIELLNHDLANAHSIIYSDSATGHYTRLIDPGVWEMVFSADGYISDTIQNVLTSTFKSTPLNIFLRPIKSAIQAVKSDNNFQFKIWPVPACQELHLSLQSGKSSRFLIRILDMSGVELQKNVVEYVPGSTIEILNISALQSGLYLLEISSAKKIVGHLLFPVVQ